MKRFLPPLILLISTALHAQVFQCTDVEGRVSFQAEACDISERVKSVDISPLNTVQPVLIPQPGSHSEEDFSFQSDAESATEVLGCRGINIQSVTPFTSTRTRRHSWLEPSWRCDFPGRRHGGKPRPELYGSRNSGDHRGNRGRNGYGQGRGGSRDYCARSGFSVYNLQCANVRAKMTGYYGELYTDRMRRRLTDRFYATFANGETLLADSITTPDGRVNIREWVNLEICFGAGDLPVQNVYCD